MASELPLLLDTASDVKRGQNLEAEAEAKLWSRGQSYKAKARTMRSRPRPKIIMKKYQIMISNIWFKIIAGKIKKIPEFYTIFALKMPDYILRQRGRGEAEANRQSSKAEANGLQDLTSLDTASKFALFSVSDLKDEKLIKKPTFMETEKCKVCSGVFWIFLPNFIKSDPYNFELYRFKVGAFFETQCRYV